MSKILDIVKNPQVIGHYIKGVLQRKKENAENKKEQTLQHYKLAFVKESDGGWYIVLPEWTGAHANLAMVAGSDLLLDHLDMGDRKVKVEVIKSSERIDNMEEYFECEQIEASLLGGSTYNVYGVEGFDRTIWICPVTLFVLGEYPKHIYIRQLN